jgi:hypothetical protein
MTIDGRLIEFLAQIDNINFLIDIEKYIPKVKEYFFNKRFDKFVEIISEDIWPNYNFETDDSFLYIYHKKHGEDDFFCFFIYLSPFLGSSEANNYFGVYGDEKIVESDIKEVVKLLNFLKAKGMKKWQYLIAYNFFERPRNHLFHLKNEGELIDFFKDWSEQFWDFANETKEILEKANEGILRKSKSKI